MVDTGRLKRQIRKNLKESSTLKELCAEFLTSAETLRKEFRKKEGIPISNFVAQVRNKNMKRFLEKTGLSCKEICCEVGIRKESGARAFKKMTGMTMMEWRRAHGDGKEITADGK